MENYSITPIDSSSLMKKAHNDLKEHWPMAIGGIVLSLLASIAASFIPFGSIIVGGPLALGISIYFLNVVRNKDARIENFFDGFKNFENALLGYFFMFLFIILWSLLFIIPGIIAAIKYAMTFFILADDREISGSDAIDKSIAMMNGHKMDYFVLNLILVLISIPVTFLTLGIGLLWFIPFSYATQANFYNSIKGYDEDDQLSLEDNLIN